jgi:hypothetical protein
VLPDFSLPGPSLYAAYVKHAGISRIRPLLKYLEEAMRVDEAHRRLQLERRQPYASALGSNEIV